MKSVRHQVCLRHRNCDPNPPNDPFEFLQSDPPCFEVREVPKAGSGLFVNRPFKKDEFIINYRGTVKPQNISTDNVYSIETGAPEFLVVDASDNLDCLARFINDVDPFHVQNCRTIKIYKDGTTTWTIAIFATKSIDTGEELRYSYGAKFAPWRDIKFWRQVASSETKRKLPCVQSQLIIEMKRKGRKKKPKVEQITHCENSKTQTEPEMKVTLAVVTGSETKGNSSIDDKVEVGLTEFNKATNDTQQQPKFVSTPFHRDFLPNNQQLYALKRHHRIAEKMAENYSGTLNQGPTSTRASKKTVKRRPVELPQQEFTPEAETEECRQELTPAAENERRQEFTPAAEYERRPEFTAEIGEAQQFTPAAENERRPEFTAEIGEAQQFTPAAEYERRPEFTAEIGEAQQFTPAAEYERRPEFTAEVGEAQQFTPAAEYERRPEFTAEIGEAQQFTPAAEYERRQEFTAEIGETQQFTPAAENEEPHQGGEHNQIDGLPHEYSEILFDGTSQVPLLGFVNDTSLTFIDLPVAATETAQESNSTIESDDDSDSEIEFRITESRNNKPKRPNVEICLLCMKEVKKMRDHLTNKHTIGTENKLRKFISTYHSTLQTNRCYQCSVCSFRFGDRGKHPKDHPIERIHDRENVDLFPQNIGFAVNHFRMQLSLPHKEFVETWMRHEKGLYEDGGTSGKWNVSSTQLTFLCQAIEATHNFKEPTNLAVFVREYVQERSLTKSTMVNYLALFEKMVDYIRAYKRTILPVIMENDWSKIIKDVRKKYQKGSLKEKRKTKRDLFEKVPDMEGVAVVVNRIQEICNADIGEKKLTLEELKVFNFVSLSCNMNGRVGPLLDLTWEEVKRIKKHGKITSDNHKTGHYYDQEIKIHQEQFPWLKRLREEFKKKHGYRAKLVFGTSLDTKDHSLAATIRKVLGKYFDEEILEKDYHGTPIRKMWDTYMHYNADQIPAEARAFHAIQSSHRPDTAEKNYIMPKTSGIDFYHDTLKRNTASSISSTPSINSGPANSTSTADLTPIAKQVASSKPTTPASKTPKTSSVAKVIQRKRQQSGGSESSYIPDSSDSEPAESETPLKLSRDTNQFRKTLNTWRDGKPSKAVLAAVSLFENLMFRITKREVENEIAKSKIKLSQAEMSRVLNKIKWAGNQHLPNKA